MENTSAADIFEHYCQAILYSLPMRDVNFLAELQKNDLLPTTVNTNLESMTRNIERASYFLDNVVKPELLNDDVHTRLDVLLEIMMDSGYDNMMELAGKVKSDLSKLFGEPATVLQRLQNKDITITLDDIRSCTEAKASTPLLKDLHNLVTPDYAAQWRAMGTQLGLKVGILNTIDHDHYHRAEDCCNAVWEEWLEMNTTATWSKVIEAVVVANSSAVFTLPIPFDNSAFTALPTATSQLQKNYIDKRYKVSQDDWPPYQPEHFTSVALIHHVHKHVTTKEVIAVANIMHKGNVITDKMQKDSSDAYLSNCNSTKDISEIFHFTDNQDVMSSIFLIEGAPGIGKTILAKEIAFQWAKKKLLGEKKLLFLIFLRDPQLSHVKTLEHFVCYAMNWSSKNKFVEAIEQYIENTAGQYCTVIVDGYDEVSEEIRTNSFISDIISHKVMKLCNLVITSRPTASAGLHDFVDHRVEILGFAKEDRTKYIHQSLEENTKEIKCIQEFLENNPFIDSLCYIPLNMTILICLFKSFIESGTELPTTQTEINNQFALVTIVRYLKKEKDLHVTLNSLSSLPSPYKKKLKNLCKLAYVFLVEDK